MKGAPFVAGLLLLAAAAPPPETPVPGERWLFNPGERTRAGLAGWNDGEGAETSREAFEQALRLAPDTVETRFNAGTARLVTGSEAAAPLLEEAAREAGAALAPRAWYDLGNARLGAGDAAGAVAAYVESLRRDPASLDAKHNLELALRALAEQQSNGANGQGDSPPENDEKGGEGSPPEQGGEEPPPKTGQSPQPEEFDPQPDMTPEQAEALLAAVESLEREQRRQEAEQRAAQRPRVEIDW